MCNIDADISVSIFILSNQLDLKSVVPFKPFTINLRQHHIDLLLINNEAKSHHILIKDIDALLSKQKHRKYLCRSCNISSFTSNSASDNHLIKCVNLEIKQKI